MKGKNGYNWPGEAIQSMKDSYELMKFFGEEFKTDIARDYCSARDAFLQMRGTIQYLNKSNLPKSLGDCK